MASCLADDFRKTIFNVVSEKSSKLFGDDCTVDFFQNPSSVNKIEKMKRGQSLKINYAVEGLSYLEKYLGKELFHPDKNILVARKGQPYPICDLINDKREEQHVYFTSPQVNNSKSNTDTDSNQNNVTIPASDNITESNYDTCGSPLKLHAYADLSSCDSPSYLSPIAFKCSESFQYVPIGVSSQSSRNLVSLFNVNYTTLMPTSVATFNSLPAFWSLCDGKHFSSVVLRGTEPLLTQLEKMQWGFRLITVSQKKITDILYAGVEIFKQNVFENTCFARYDLVDPAAHTFEDQTAYQGSLSLEFHWTNGTELLQKPGFYSEAVIKASVCSGDVRSPAIGLFEELKILKSFMTGLAINEINWAASKAHTPLLDSVKELIENLKLGDADDINKLEIEHSENSPSDRFKLKERLYYDFTDYLWKILITCSSYKDLISCLNYIFKALGMGEFQPAVHKENKTMMAQFIRDSYMGRLSIPHLGGMFALKLVVEIGIEKLRCDYVHAFVSQELTTPGHLEYFMQSDLELEEKIIRLEKLQYSLEMVAMVHLFLQLPYSILGTCARKMLKYFETNSINECELFEFPVETKHVLPIARESVPSLWSLTVAKKNINDMFEYKVWTLTTSQPFLHLPQEAEEICTSENNREFFLTYREDKIIICG